MEGIHPAMPPDSLAAPWPYHLRRQGAVFLAVPFPSDVRIENREGGLEARTGSYTHGASFAVHPSRDDSRPDMAGIHRAAPPNALVAPGFDGIWSQVAVLFGVPLLSELRMRNRQ